MRVVIKMGSKRCQVELGIINDETVMTAMGVLAINMTEKVVLNICTIFSMSSLRVFFMVSPKNY